MDQIGPLDAIHTYIHIVSDPYMHLDLIMGLKVYHCGGP